MQLGRKKEAAAAQKKRAISLVAQRHIVSFRPLHYELLID